MSEKFPSLREESIEIAIHTRRNILEGQSDAISTLRSCLVIAENLGKQDDKEWILCELKGEFKEFPDYRIVSAAFYESYNRLSDYFDDVPISLKLAVILSRVNKGKDITLQVKSKNYLIQLAVLEGVVSDIIDRCLIFLNKIINELQYGGIVEYLMEEIRTSTDSRLSLIDEKLLDEAKSLIENLSSTNPADWNKVGHSSRKMLLLMADKVFPARTTSYALKNGKALEVGQQNYINRLIAFLDMNLSGEQQKLITSEIEYLSCYLKDIANSAQIVEHVPSIDKYHANMQAIHTYLILSEIIRHIKQ